MSPGTSVPGDVIPGDIIPGDVITVPYPYTNRPVTQRRPALVVARFELATVPPLLWVLMITSAENRSWPGDVPITDLARAGLPVASVVRSAKIATLESTDALRIGMLDDVQFATLVHQLGSLLGTA